MLPYCYHNLLLPINFYLSPSRAVELTSPFNQHHSSGHSLGHRGRDPKKSFEDITGAPKTPGQTFTAGPLETTLYPPNPARHKPELHQASFRINRRNRRHLISSVVHERDLSQRNRDLKSSVVEVVFWSAREDPISGSEVSSLESRRDYESLRYGKSFNSNPSLMLAPFDLTKKKKKTFVVQNAIKDSAESHGRHTIRCLIVQEEGYIAEHPNDEEEVEGIDLHQQRYPWEGSDMDYLYDEASGDVTLGAWFTGLGYTKSVVTLKLLPHLTLILVLGRIADYE
ncbi:hypothetical protein Bca4012_050353 [Brassica carinata]